MKTKIIRIGNSRGIRIPKPMLEEAGLGDEVELRLTDSGLVVEPAGPVRAGWGSAAAALASRSDEADSDVFTSTDFDESDWEW